MTHPNHNPMSSLSSSYFDIADGWGQFIVLDDINNNLKTKKYSHVHFLKKCNTFTSLPCAFETISHSVVINITQIPQQITPLHIDYVVNAQSVSPRSLITAPEESVLNVQRCKKVNMNVNMNVNMKKYKIKPRLVLPTIYEREDLINKNVIYNNDYNDYNDYNYYNNDYNDYNDYNNKICDDDTQQKSPRNMMNKLCTYTVLGLNMYVSGVIIFCVSSVFMAKCYFQ